MTIRKLTALLIAFLLVTGSALADTTVTLLKRSDVTVTLSLKAGDTAGQPSSASGDVTRVTVSRPGCADVIVSAAYADMDAPLSLADMPKADVAALTESMQADYPGADVTTRTTSAGNLYLMADMHGDYDLHSMYTLYHGFWIELLQYHGDFSPLTSADEAFLLDVLQGLWIK